MHHNTSLKQHYEVHWCQSQTTNYIFVCFFTPILVVEQSRRRRRFWSYTTTIGTPNRKTHGSFTVMSMKRRLSKKEATTLFTPNRNQPCPCPGSPSHQKCRNRDHVQELVHKPKQPPLLQSWFHRGDADSSASNQA